MTLTEAPPRVHRGRIGDSPTRPDAVAKVDGSFQFSSDLPVDGAAWGPPSAPRTRTPRIASIDVTPALAIPGVHAVLTAADVPGASPTG